MKRLIVARIVSPRPPVCWRCSAFLSGIEQTAGLGLQTRTEARAVIDTRPCGGSCVVVGAGVNERVVSVL